MEAFNYLDLIVVLAVLVVGIRGFFRGFVSEVFGLVGIIGGLFLANEFYRDLSIPLNQSLKLESEALVIFISFIIIFITVWIISIIIGVMIEKLLDISGLSIVNKLFGFIVGSAKVFLIFSVMIYMLSTIDIFNDMLKKVTADSFVYKYLVKTGEAILGDELSNQKDLMDINSVMKTIKPAVKE